VLFRYGVRVDAESHCGHQAAFQRPLFHRRDGEHGAATIIGVDVVLVEAGAARVMRGLGFDVGDVIGEIVGEE
jgi:hypothetical protein